MVESFLIKGTCPELKVIFVDEAQDLSLIQWAMLKKLIKDNDNPDVWIAGDDDQAIFGWAGADVNSFIAWPGQEIPLTKSRRVPIDIQTKALDVISRVGINRIQKDYLPKEERGEIVERFKLTDLITDMEKGDWLILTRTNSLLKPILPILKRHGLFFQTAQGNSIGKSLYEDIGYWNQMREEKEIPDIQRQRVEERMSEVDITLPWQKLLLKCLQLK